MTEKINFLENISDDYSYSLSTINGDVVLYFRNSKIVFGSYLIFKNGYPNEEVYYAQPSFLENDLEPSVLYQIIDSSWIKEIITINQIHPRHTDKLFKDRKHFIIFFEDEVFECIANTYEIVSVIN